MQGLMRRKIFAGFLFVFIFSMPRSLAQTREADAKKPSTLGETVSQDIHDTLGWKPRPGDAKGFAGALNRSFEPAQAQERREAEWSWAPKEDLPDPEDKIRRAVREDAERDRLPQRDPDDRRERPSER